jgi:hypothetical protein
MAVKIGSIDIEHYSCFVFRVGSTISIGCTVYSSGCTLSHGICSFMESHCASTLFIAKYTAFFNQGKYILQVSIISKSLAMTVNIL